LGTAVAKINAELAGRYLVWGASYWESNREIARANMLKENALSDLNYRIMVTDWEKDQITQPNITGRKRVKEPGGIKFNGQRADALEPTSPAGTAAERYPP
jgi:hypothetical protein